MQRLLFREEREDFVHEVRLILNLQRCKTTPRHKRRQGFSTMVDRPQAANCSCEGEEKSEALRAFLQKLDAAEKELEGRII